jgi:hypothetical protein
LFPGKAGALQTLTEMKRLIIEAIHSQFPRQAAIELIQSSFVPYPEIFVSALRIWIEKYVTIIDEFEELLISPIYMIQKIMVSGQAFGDCDDVAMLSASILASIGARVRLLAVFPQEDGSFAHVITQYSFERDSEWKDFDGTIPFIGEYPEKTLALEIIS